MEPIELVATSLAEAHEKAALQLGAPTDQVMVEVLEESKGLFGKPGKVTVRAWVEGGGAEADAEPEAETEDEPKPKAKAKAKPKAKAKEDAPVEAAAEDPAASSEGDVDEEPGEREVAEASEDDAEKLVKMLQGLMDAADFQIDVKPSGINGRYVNINLDGNDVGFLIGRRGETLNALQYFMNVVAARQLQNGVRVVLEGDNYREKRADFLTKMAQDIAAQVRDRGEEAVLDALPAFERRVIHQALVDYEGVATYSEGEEPGRRVVIAPAEN